jgi:hypothetical protein
MPKTTIILLSVLTLLYAAAGVCKDPPALVRLKQAGIGEEVIRALVEEKSLETQALTMTEILALKHAGLDDKALVKLIRAGSFMRHRQPIQYRTAPLRSGHWRTEEIRALRELGLADAVIVALLAAESGPEQRRHAWRMLERMGLVIDNR